MISNNVTDSRLNTTQFKTSFKDNINKIAFIDFDGTIVNSHCVDYLIEINKSLKNKSSFILWRILLQFKGPLFYFLNKFSAFLFDKYYYRFYKGLKSKEVNKVIEESVIPYIKNNIFPQAVDEIKKLRSQNYHVVVISGTLKNIVEPIALEIGANDCIATHLEEQNGLFTGKVKGYFVNHFNKRRAIAKYCLYNNYRPEKIVVYGNSKWDIGMLEVADKSYAINPDKKLSKWSDINGCKKIKWGFEKIPFRFYFLHLFFRPLIKNWEGLDNIPKNKGVIIIANHSSYLDHYIIGLTIMCRYNRRVRFLAKKSTLTHRFKNGFINYWEHFLLTGRKGGKKVYNRLSTCLNKVRLSCFILKVPGAVMACFTHLNQVFCILISIVVVR